MADVNWNLALYDPIAKQKQGFDYATQVAGQAALLRAGSQYAGGDISGAANTVARSGDFKTAGDLSTLATRRQAGQLYAGGDAAGAGKALAGGGDFETAGKLQEQQIKTIEAQQDAMGRTGSFLTAALADPNLAQNPNLPQQAWSLARQQLAAAQIPPERIAEFEKMFAADPKKAAAIMSHIATEVKVTSDGQGTLYLTDKYGNVVNKLGGDRAYPGTSPESTDLNNLLRGVKDPAFRSTPEYAAAWNRQNAQKDQIINGKFVSIPGNVGSWAPAPGAYQGAPAPAPAAAPPNEPPPPSGTPTPTPTPLAPGSEPLPPGVTSRVAPINPPPPPTRRIDRPQVSAEAPPAPAASAPPGPGASNVRVADIPGLEPRGMVRDATQEELTARGYKPGTRGQINQQTGQLVITDKPTEADYKTAEYANRLTHAAENLDRLNQQGIIKPTAQVLISDRNGVLRFVFSNQKDRQFVQAAKEWLAPVVRKDSGAAVTETEYDQYQDIYIPRPEDGPEVIAQKAAARQVFEDTLYGQAGPLAVQMYGQRKPRAKPPTARGPYAPGKGQPFIPKPSIEALRQNPQRAAEFDKKYGAGAAKSVLGR